MATQTQVAAPATGRPCGRCLASSRARYGHPHVCCARTYCCGIEEHQNALLSVWALRIDPETHQWLGQVVELLYQLDDDPPRYLRVNVRVHDGEWATMVSKPGQEPWFWGRYA